MRSSRIGSSGYPVASTSGRSSCTASASETSRCGDQAQRHEQCAELLGRLLLHAQRAIEPARVELAALDQNLAEALAHRRRSGSPTATSDSGAWVGVGVGAPTGISDSGGV